MNSVLYDRASHQKLINNSGQEPVNNGCKWIEYDHLHRNKIKCKKREKICRGLCAAQHYLDIDAVRDLYPHKLAESTFVRIEIDEALVNTHFPAVPGLTSLPIGAFPARNLQLLRRKGYRSAYVYAGPLGYPSDLAAHAVYFLRVCSAK